MAKTLDEIIAALHNAADSVEPALQQAFLDAIAELQSSISIEELTVALQMQTVDVALGVTQVDKLDDLLFGVGMNNTGYVFSTQMQTSFVAGAMAAINNLTDAQQKAIAFNALNERAVAVMRQRGAQLIQELTSTTRAGVQSAILRALNDNIPPNKAAIEIKQLIGLTDAQMQAVFNFRQQLEARSNLGFVPAVERRLSAVEQAMVSRHMREGHFTQNNIVSMVQRYYESLLNKRAKDIARTEAMSSVNAGQLELWQQGLDLGIFDDNIDRKFWIVTPDDRLRDSHRAIPIMNPIGVKIQAMFITPFGPVFGPGDYNVNLINCRCVTVLGEYGQNLNYY